MGHPMEQGSSTQDRGLEFIRRKKVVTLDELVRHLHCSARTVQRWLAKWQAISSYNRNGSCYSLPDIAAFDADGLWRYRGIFFSRFGTLSATFVQLATNAPAGLTAAEASERLGVRANSFLWSLRNHPQLVREKHQGVYVYFGSEESICKKQREQRSPMAGKARLPTDLEAVAILVEKIKCPILNNEELSKRLGKQRLCIAPEVIGNLFAKHGLGVKKTLRSIGSAACPDTLAR